MADINNRTFSTDTIPRVSYLITYKGVRPNNSEMTYNFTIKSSLPSGHYLLTGYAIYCYITVGGVKKGVRLKASTDLWRGSNSWTKTLSVTCPSTSTANLPVTFQTISDGSLDTEGCGILKDSSYTVAANALLYTSATAPTTFTASPNPFQNTVNLSWDGAKGGTSNGISAYEIQYAAGPITSAFGAWTAEVVHSSTAAKNTITRTISDSKVPEGHEIKFRIRTRGTAGSSYYSGWKECTKIVKNRTPIKPQSLTVSKYKYNQGDTLTLSWQGASDADGNITHYVLEYSLYEGGQWGSWQTLKTVTTSATGGSAVDTPQRTANQGVMKYRIKAVDALGMSSGWTESSTVKRDDYTGVYLSTGTAWQKGYPHVCVNGVWMPAVIYYGSNGEWKQGKD